jgi:hypothetical protein
MAGKKLYNWLIMNLIDRFDGIIRSIKYADKRQGTRPIKALDLNSR